MFCQSCCTGYKLLLGGLGDKKTFQLVKVLVFAIICWEIEVAFTETADRGPSWFLLLVSKHKIVNVSDVCDFRFGSNSARVLVHRCSSTNSVECQRAKRALLLSPSMCQHGRHEVGKAAALSSPPKQSEPEWQRQGMGKTHHFTTADIKDGDEVEVGCVADQRGRRKTTKEKQLKKHAMFEICQWMCEEGIFIYLLYLSLLRFFLLRGWI